MPFYQFTVTAGSATARRKAEVAAAVTTAHAAMTGAPREYVNRSFAEVPPGSIFAWAARSTAAAWSGSSGRAAARTSSGS
jgi:phenylpyruvate tautomerase PptA (4-oxalocrotonate tautomerase family)